MVPMLKTSIGEYFAGERREMIIIVVTFIVITSYAVILLWQARSGFMVAFATIVAVCGGVSSVGAISLIARDRVISANLERQLSDGRGESEIITERARIGTVLTMYPVYRRIAALLVLLALSGLLFSRAGWVHGISAAILILIAGQTLVDHFSEQRALLYSARISHGL